MKNRIDSIALSDYSEYIEGKHRNGGAYGYDEVYTYSPDMDCFVFEWFTTSELTPDGTSQGKFTLEDVMFEVADFVRHNANSPNCTVYVNGVAVWESTPSEDVDVDTSIDFLDD